jgi:hypothetical protein
MTFKYYTGFNECNKQKTVTPDTMISFFNIILHFPEPSLVPQLELLVKITWTLISLCRQLRV